MREVQTKIEHLTLQQVIKKSEIFFDPDFNNTVIEDDQGMIDIYNLLPDPMDQQMKNIYSHWVIRMVLDTEKLAGH